MLQLYRGDSWTISWEWLDNVGAPVDMTGASARMQLRRTATSTTPAMEASTAAGTMSIEVVTGIITLNATPAMTADLVGRYSYDVEVTFADDSVTTMTAGAINVKADITR